MSIIGIIGVEEGDEQLVIDGLVDLRDQAAAANDVFWSIIGVTPESPEVLATIIQWHIDEEIAYDLVVHPDVFDAVPEEFSNGADKKSKIKAVDNKVVDRLLAEDGTHLLVLLGAEADASDELTAVCQKAFDGGLAVLDLNDGNAEIGFSNDNEGEPETGEDEPNYDELGEAADNGDAEAQGQLEDLARAVDIDPDTIATYAELAEMLKPAEEEAPKAPAKKAASPKAAPAAKKGAPTKWTEELLSDKPLKELKAIAVASGIDGAGKMAATALVKALVGKPMGEEAAPEEEPEAEEKPAPAAKGKAAAKPSAKGKPLDSAPDTGDTELNDILSMVNTAFTRLINYIASK